MYNRLHNTGMYWLTCHKYNIHYATSAYNTKQDNNIIRPNRHTLA